MDLVKHPPWRTNDSAMKDGEEMPEVIKMDMKEEDVAKDELSVPKSMNLKKEDFETHGYSAKCPGCEALLEGTRAVGHSEEGR